MRLPLCAAALAALLAVPAIAAAAPAGGYGCTAQGQRKLTLSIPVTITGAPPSDLQARVRCEVTFRAKAGGAESSCALSGEMLSLNTGGWGPGVTKATFSYDDAAYTPVAYSCKMERRTSNETLPIAPALTSPGDAVERSGLISTRAAASPQQGGFAIVPGPRDAGRSPRGGSGN